MALIVDIEKQLEKFRLKVKLQADTGVLALLGASGSGKSMTLKCIAGIEKPDRGYIELDGRVLFDSDKRICLSPQKRHAGYLFQQFALFPNMTVRQNVLCGIRKSAPGDAEKRAAEILRRMHLDGLGNRFPAQISGGEQQRAALARILVNDPEVLLLDEPFSALDTHLRFRLEKELRDLLREFENPVLLVSHDRDEAYRLAERLAVIRNGSIETAGTKQEVFADPETADAARMTGCKNISRIRPCGDDRIFAEDWGIVLRTGRIPDGDRRFAGIRMHDLRLISDPGEKAPDSMASGARKEQEEESAEEICRDNLLRCRVAEEIENPFSYTIMLQPLNAVPGGVPVGIELDKKKWKDLRNEELQVYFQPEQILLLR